MAGGGSLKKVTRGQPLRIPADAYNAFVDAAEAYRRAGRFGAPGAGAGAGQATVFVRNDSGGDRGRFHALGLETAAFLPSLNLLGFQRWPVLGGVTPTLRHAGLTAVLLEPLLAGRVGRAVVAGVTACLVRMIYETDRCADVDEQSAATLRSCEDGPARLLWVQPPADRAEPDKAWALALLGPGRTRTQRVLITDAEEIGPNRFAYSWAEARWTGSNFAAVPGGYTDADWGLAYNGIENSNGPIGVQGSGIDVANLSGTFAHRPIGVGAAPKISGPLYDAAGNPAWAIDFANNVDGSCPS